MRPVAALGLVALLLGATPAIAKDRPPSLELKVTLRKSKVALLERVPLKVEVRNKGGTVELPPLRIADDSLTVVLREAKAEIPREFRLRRIYGTWSGENLVPESVSRGKLRGGTKLTETVEMVAIRPGDYEVRVELSGVEGLTEPVASRPVELTVAPPPEGQQLRLKIRTSFGDMTAELYPDVAYDSCHEFVLHALDGHFGHGMTFFRILENFMAQTGDPSNTGTKGYGYYLPQEFNAVKHEPGVLSLARSTPENSANGQFFIMHGTSPGLDGKYTAFGKVIEGLEVIDKIAKVRKGPSPSNPQETSKPLERVELLGVDAAVR